MGSTQTRYARAEICLARHGERRLAFDSGRVKDRRRGDWDYVGLCFALPEPADWRRALGIWNEHERRRRAAGDPLPRARSLRRRQRTEEVARAIATGLGWRLTAAEESELARMASDRTRQLMAVQ